MGDKHYVGEIGTEIIVDCGCTITGADPTTLKVRKPDGTEEEWDASIEGTDSLKHTTEEDDFDQAGKYRVQASLTLGAWTGLGETTTFVVYEEYR